MHKEIIEKYYIQNNELFESSSIGSIKDLSADTIYEVVRVIKGVPLFLEMHLNRLSLSAEIIGYSIDGLLAEIVSNINRLIKENNYPEKNIKILIFNLSNPKPNYILCFIHSNYPAETLYRDGIHTILHKSARIRPNIKAINISFKEDMQKLIQYHISYEVLLVNGDNEITEGSKSNVFFIKNDQLYTCPGNKVLLGITRRVLFDICKKQNIKINEIAIPVDFINDIDGAFITGTSPKLLPIKNIDKTLLETEKNPLFKRLLDLYQQRIQEYIELKSKN